MAQQWVGAVQPRALASRVERAQQRSRRRRCATFRGSLSTRPNGHDPIPILCLCATVWTTTPTGRGKERPRSRTPSRSPKVEPRPGGIATVKVCGSFADAFNMSEGPERALPLPPDVPMFGVPFRKMRRLQRRLGRHYTSDYLLSPRAKEVVRRAAFTHGKVVGGGVYIDPLRDTKWHRGSDWAALQGAFVVVDGPSGRAAIVKWADVKRAVVLATLRCGDAQVVIDLDHEGSEVSLVMQANQGNIEALLTFMQAVSVPLGDSPDPRQPVNACDASRAIHRSPTAEPSTARVASMPSRLTDEGERLSSPQAASDPVWWSLAVFTDGGTMTDPLADRNLWIAAVLECKERGITSTAHRQFDDWLARRDPNIVEDCPDNLLREFAAAATSLGPELLAESDSLEDLSADLALLTAYLVGWDAGRLLYPTGVRPAEPVSVWLGLIGLCAEWVLERPYPSDCSINPHHLIVMISCGLVSGATGSMSDLHAKQHSLLSHTPE